MTSFRPRRRRFRVVARPQVRARRARAVAAVLAVGALGAVAFATARRLAADLRHAALPLPRAFSGPDAVAVEGPEPLRSLAQDVAASVPGSAGEKAAALKARFPCLADVRVRRPWTERTATLTLEPRRAAAPARRRGKAAGFLGEDGAVFEAPAGLYVLSGPEIDVDGAPSAELAAAAREWRSLSAPGAFPAPLAALAYRSAEDGWEARLADGTVVLWGKLDFTSEKLARLGEALADARGRQPGAFSADLRWFEDGKVLLKPVGFAAGALRK